LRGIGQLLDAGLNLAAIAFVLDVETPNPNFADNSNRAMRRSKTDG